MDVNDTNRRFLGSLNDRALRAEQQGCYVEAQALRNQLAAAKVVR